ncbi:MAG TPA: isochorismatase family cysteine hydrolase [Candidatus Solibacter sp.]|nr:isochorismatase family cysteine hydrolase [Candidatus Solibacter sp.]
MADGLSFLPAHTALIGMDCQTGVVAIYTKPSEPFLERCASVLQAGRRAGMPVIHIKVGFHPGLPEVTTRTRLFASIKSSPQHQKLFEGESGAIHPKLGPVPDDIVVTKHRISAFPGSDLQMILRAKEVDTLVLFGIATSGVVLSTLLEACDADYRTLVISDCCADTDLELQRVLIERLFPLRGQVTTAAEFVRAAGK